MSFHLALAKAYRFRLVTEAFVTIHAEAPLRITAAPPAPFAAALLESADDQARDADAILEEHGEAVRAFAPSLLEAPVRTATLHHIPGDHRGSRGGSCAQWRLQLPRVRWAFTRT